MRHSSPCVRRLIHLAVLTAIALPLSQPLSFARPGLSKPSQEAKVDPGRPAQSPPEIRQLEIGKPIERELRGGQSHVYEIQLVAGQYLSAIVDQRGIDVAITVIGADGKPLIEADAPNGALGPERVG